MELEGIPKVFSPSSAPHPTGDEWSIWESLVPRLIHPTKLAIVEALRLIERPLSVDDLLKVLGPEEGSSWELVNYHVKSMAASGVLVTDVRPQPSGARSELLVFFDFPSAAKPSSISVTAPV